MKFSVKTQSFYAEGLDFADTLPGDLVNVNEVEGSLLYRAVNEGCYIYLKEGRLTTSIPKPDIYHIWNEEKECWYLTADAAIVRKTDAVNAVESKRQELITVALSSIGLIQLKLQAERELSIPEATKLNEVLDYIDSLNALDLSNATDILWP